MITTISSPMSEIPIYGIVLGIGKNEAKKTAAPIKPRAVRSNRCLRVSVVVSIKMAAMRTMTMEPINSTSFMRWLLALQASGSGP